MATINDIQFNTNLFTQFNPWFAILYQINEGIALFIRLYNIDLLTFTRPFDEIIPCQDFIKETSRKTFILFTYSDNIDTWLWNNNPIPDNLDEIIIFCPFPENVQYYRDWTRRYTRRVTNVFTYNILERELLIFGMRYIDNLRLNFQGNPETLRLLTAHREGIRLALINAFEQAANNI